MNITVHSTDDDNRSYRNVCNISFVSFALAVIFIKAIQHFRFSCTNFESRGTIYSYFEIGLKPTVVSCLTNAIAHPQIARETCSRAQTNRTVF